jgi:hypothetical protein
MGHFIMFSVIINIYNKKPKGSTLMELFTAKVKQPEKNFFSFPVTVINSIKVGPLVFLVINFCNHGEHYDTPRI